MGADIHLYVEKKLKNGEWAFVRDLNETINGEGLRPWGDDEGKVIGGFWKLSGRNYTLFAKLASVRGVGGKAKGLPHDVSDLIYEEHEAWGSDAHSASWSTPLEFMEAYIDATQWHSETEHEELSKYVQMRIKEGTERSLEVFMRDMCSLDMDRGEYRFVYWFDN